jgi:hypothetical protein
MKAQKETESLAHRKQRLLDMISFIRNTKIELDQHISRFERMVRDIESREVNP